MDLDWLSDGFRDAVKIAVVGAIVWIWKRVRGFAVKLREVVEDHASAKAVEDRCASMEARIAALEQRPPQQRPSLPGLGPSPDLTDPNTSPRFVVSRNSAEED